MITISVNGASMFSGLLFLIIKWVGSRVNPYSKHQPPLYSKLLLMILLLHADDEAQLRVNDF
jgi:hypothetical protein